MKLDREAVLTVIDAVLEGNGEPGSAARFDHALRVLQLGDAALEEGEREYLYGYLRYLHPERRAREADCGQALVNLRAAYELATRSSLRGRAALYVGHCLYDARNESEAQTWFRRALSFELPAYLELKAPEMVACAAIVLRQEGWIRDFERYAKRAQHLPCQDIWPNSLARVLRSLEPAALSPSEQASLARHAGLVDSAGQHGRWLTQIVEEA